MSRGKRVTIKDVAREAGVSTQTVSRVVNERPNVLPATRARVQQAIVRMGYSPNVLARSLSQGRTYTLGVVGFGLRFFGSTSVLTGIEQKSNELGYSMLLSLLDQFDETHIDAILRNLVSHQVEGIIWAVPGNVRTTDIVTAKTKELPIPIVFLNCESEPGQSVAAVNNRHGGRMATQHLLEQGYRRVSIIAGPKGWWEARERELGWREAMLEAGQVDLDDLKVAGDWSSASGEQGFQLLYEKAPDIDAVFVGNDQMALGVLKAARNLGLLVPQDLGVVGFDDIPEAAYFYPALSTLRQSGEAVGSASVEQIRQMIDAAHTGSVFHPNTCWVEPQLIIRNSSQRRKR